MKKLLTGVALIAREAGAEIIRIYEEGDFQTTYKKDAGDSPLTKADLAAHKIIEAGLKKLTPEIPFLSEESKAMPFDERSAWDKFWLVDPLDGTKEFIKRSGEFTVNIALIEVGKPTLGVVYAPVIDIIYIAARGLGAFKAGSGEADFSNPIKAAPYAGGMLKLVASKSHGGAGLEKFMTKIEGHELVSMGSSLKLCLVADGTAHLYPRLGPTMEWDTAAAHAVVNCAGGRVTDLDKNELTYNKPDQHNPFFIVATEPPYPWWNHTEGIEEPCYS